MNKPTRWKALAYAAALFVFGIVIGATVLARMPANPQTLRVGRLDEIEQRIRDRLVSKLNLTPEQQTKFKPMIQQAAQALETSHLGCLKKVNEALDNLHAQIGPELTPEQRQKLTELEAERTELMWNKYHYRPEATNALVH